MGHPSPWSGEQKCRADANRGVGVKRCGGERVAYRLVVGLVIWGGTRLCVARVGWKMLASLEDVGWMGWCANRHEGPVFVRIRAGTRGHIRSCFFFSSRRRHTRFDCDWSSDVCSSDLGPRPPRRPNVRVRETDHAEAADTALPVL